LVILTAAAYFAVAQPTFRANKQLVGRPLDGWTIMPQCRRSELFSMELGKKVSVSARPLLISRDRILRAQKLTEKKIKILKRKA
jgi:hypothetical protein